MLAGEIPELADAPEDRRSGWGAGLGCKEVLEAEAGCADERPPRTAGPYAFHAPSAASRLNVPAAGGCPLFCPGGPCEGPVLFTSFHTMSNRPDRRVCRKPTTLFWKDAIVVSSSASFAEKNGCTMLR